MSVWGPRAGDYVDEAGVHRHRDGTRRTILDVAADSFVPSAETSGAIDVALASFKPKRLLEPSELAERLTAEAAQLRLVERRKRLHDSGIVRVLPRPSRDVTLIVEERLEDRPALSFVKAWWADGEPFKPWLMMGGTIGVGKTWAAAWAIAETGGKYITCADLIRVHAARKAARGPMQTPIADAAWTRVLHAPVLVLDEFGREPWNEVRDAFHDLVNERGSKLTLVLSNVASADVRTAFESGALDKRTVSRLAPLLLKDRSGRGCWDVVGDDLREVA